MGGCPCAEFGKHLCPFHLMLKYRADFAERFGHDAEHLDSTLPAFPDFEGNVISKTAMVVAIEQAVETIDEPARDVAGRRRFGGHSCRVAGSRFWAHHGMEIYKLQIFARWGSDVILRYVADAPLHQVKIPMATRGPSSSSSSSLEVADTTIAKLDAKIVKLTSFVEDAVKEVKNLKLDVARLTEEARKDVVLNVTSGCWHEVLFGDVDIQPALWKTRCGWKFARLNHVRDSRVPHDATRCDRCFGRPAPSTSSSASSS